MTDTTESFHLDLTGLPEGPDPRPTESSAPTIESLCGPDDLQDVETYDGTLGVTKEFVRRYASAVCRIRWKSDLSAYRNQGNVAGAAFGTATLVAPNVIATCSHLFEEDKGWRFPLDNQTGRTIGASEAAINMVAEFGYQRDPNGKLRSALVVPIRDMIVTRPSGLDAALLQLETSPGERFGWIEMTERAPVDAEPVTVIQHPSGDPKKVESGTIGRIGPNNFGYGDLDTLGGSSGSPVLDRLGRMIGIHIAGGCGNPDLRSNFATRLDSVLETSSDFREAIARSRRLDLDARERIAVTWAADPDRNGYDNVGLATLTTSGRTESATEPLNPTLAGHQLVPRVATDREGAAVVAWADDADENDFYNIEVMGAERKHTRSFGPQIAHKNGAGQQLAPSIGAADDGDFVIAWQDDADRNGFYNVFVRGFDAEGRERFATTQSHRDGSGQQLRPVVAVAKESGDFVVAWEDDRDRNGELSIIARRFSSTGQPIGGDLAVNARSSFHQHGPAVAMSPSGRYFAAAWEDDADNNRFYNIRMKVFELATGKVELVEHVAHPDGAGQQRRPSIAINDDGRVAIAYENDADRNGFTNVRVRSVDISGRQIFSVQPHGEGAGNQRNPVIAFASDGTLAVGLEDDVNLDGWYSPLVCGLDGDGKILWNTRLGG